MSDTGTEQTEGDQPSRLKAIEDWFKRVQGDVERATPELLDELAREARSFAQRLEDIAAKSRKKQEREGETHERTEPPGSETQEIARHD